MITVNGVWYINQLSNHCVVEFENGELAKFNIVPFRTLTDSDFTLYKGYHPRKMKGQPMPEYIYRFYGLKRNDESLSETVRLRLSPSEKEKLDGIAKNEGKTVSEYLRDYIRRL